MADKFSYQKATEEIEAIIEEIENDSTNIDELTEKIKKAAILIKKCQQKLISTQNEVNKLLENIDEE